MSDLHDGHRRERLVNSGWGTGQLVAWLDGGREEVQLEFTAAEQWRPINWRELIGAPDRDISYIA